MSDDYRQRMDEIRKIEKEINAKVSNLKKKQPEENTTRLELEIEKDLANMNRLLQNLKAQYEKMSGNNIPGGEREYTKRVNEIGGLILSHDRIQGTLESFRKKKYGYQGDLSKYDNYQESEEMKGMSNRQLLDYAEKKVEAQNLEVDDIVGEVKKGKEKGKAIKNALVNQNVKLEKVQEDV